MSRSSSISTILFNTTRVVRKHAITVTGIAGLSIMLVGSAGATVAKAAPTAQEGDTFGPIVTQSTKNDLSPALRSITPIVPAAGEGIREIPNFQLPNREGSDSSGSSDLAPQGAVGDPSMPAPILTFEGVNNVNGVLPPDTQGDVGPNHYVQMVNISFAIWDKSGTLLFGPANNNTLFSGFGGPCETTNNGDPIVLYDEQADRWMLSQFALPNFPNGPFYECIAVSQTPDPTGAYYRYEFTMPVDKMNDYPKFGVWPDGYYMSVNQFNAGTLSWGGAGAAVFERSQMLTGASAQLVYFDQFGVNPNFGAQLPSDMDGPAPPGGTPNFFTEWDDSAWIGPNDSVRVWEFDVDWVTPANSTFGVAGQPNNIVNTSDVDPNMCGFARNCIPLPSPGVSVDAISGQVMFRNQYRNFGSYETLVMNQTVDVDSTDHAGVHWIELRDSGSGWTLQQDGVHAPDSDHRWMGSIAMDKDGNIALGYSVSSTSTFPSIRYTGRLAGDPLGTMPQGEATLISGSGVQTHSSGRWGDYSMMSVDPVDDCTFWYTQEYYAVSGSASWQTRIGEFRFPSCGEVGGPPDIVVDPTSLSSVQQPNDVVVKPLNISNVGGEDLDWVIEESSSAPAVQTDTGLKSPNLKPEIEPRIGGAIIDNGVIQVGVHDEGHLNVPGGTPSSGTGTTVVGLRYLPTNAEATAPGCLCEGWGVADTISGVTGFANEFFGGAINIVPVSYVSTPSTAVSVVQIGTTFEVTHDYHPSPLTPNLYEVTVTVENISANEVDLRYRRVMDWDVEPTAFAEFVTIQGTAGAVNVLFASDDGFAQADPLSGPTFINFTGDAIDDGPADHGALFDFGFGPLPVGDSFTFTTYYGAAGTEGEALAAIAAVGAEVYSFGQPNTPDGPSGYGPIDGTPNTFIFAFAGVGGTPICESGDIPWASVSPASGTTPPALTTTVDVAFDSTGLGEGSYTGNLCVASNDPDEPLVVVPVELTVESGPPDIEVDPTSLFSAQPTGSVVVKPLDISNVGGENLDWEVIEELPSVSIAPSGIDFPRGTAAPSHGVPTGGKPSQGSTVGESLESLLSPGSSAFSTESMNLFFTQFDLDIPEVLNNLGPAPTQLVWAGDFAGADFSKTYNIRDDNVLVTLSTATGAETVIGAVPAPPDGEAYTGMSYDPTTDTMYASSCNITTSRLYVVDLVTPTTTLVGEITNSPCTIAIGVTDTGQMFGHDLVNDSLMSINKATGAGTVIGPLGFDANFGQGMEYDSATGQLYLAAFNNGTFQPELRIADTTTGATALVGVLGQTSPGGLIQMGWMAVEGVGVGCVAGDIPWFSANPTTGTTPPGGTDTLDATFDSTGLSPGSYSGNLCVLSNDPDEALVVVPVDLEVGGEADLWIDPASSEVPINGEVTVDIRVGDVTDLFGIQLELSFDPSIVEVVDVDDVKNGIQIDPGSCPLSDFVVANGADNFSGTIQYAASSLAPTPPCSPGGIVASITFRGLAEGTSPVAFVSWLLSDPDGIPIGVETVTDGEIVVISDGRIEGFVDLQGRTDDSGAEVCATGGGSPICTTTDSDGYYIVTVPQDTYTVEVEMDRYLDGSKSGVVVVAGNLVTLSTVELLGGDAIEDDVINILDLSFIGFRFGLTDSDPGWDAQADINDDLIINILDVVLAAGNFLATSPVPWP